jgi:hypothetical protein
MTPEQKKLWQAKQVDAAIRACRKYGHDEMAQELMIQRNMIGDEATIEWLVTQFRVNIINVWRS